MTYYATHDFDDTINCGANFMKVASRDEALAWFRKGYKNSGLIVVDVTDDIDFFADYWVKLHHRPTADELEDYAEDIGCSADDLIVQNPGSHPGGNAWWITPRINILTPVLKEESE